MVYISMIWGNILYNTEMKRRSYKERFKIPLDGDSNIEFFTKGGLLLAKGYERIVIGARGPYIEFTSEQIVHDNIFIPKHAEHKLENSLSYYYEYRSKDECRVKLYDQKIGVQYADYKPGLWYIDPYCLKTRDFDELILPLYPDPLDFVEPENTKEGTLFDE